MKDKALKNTFINAVKNDEEGVARKLLSYGFKLNSKDPEGAKALVEAVKANKENMVDVLLAAGVSPDVKDKLGAPVLVSAAKADSLPIARVLLTYKADANIKDSLGNTPLIYAVKNKNDEMTELLMANGAGVTTYNKAGQTIMSFANNDVTENTKKMLEKYTIDFSKWSEKDIKDYIERSEYNLQEAKRELEQRKSTLNVPVLKYTDAAPKQTASSKTKPVAKPKATSKNQNKVNQNKVKTNPQQEEENLVNTLIVTEESGLKPQVEQQTSPQESNPYDF